MSPRPTLRVLDCSDLSGAFCAKVLAGIGARIEYPARRDCPADDRDNRHRATFYGRSEGITPCGSTPPVLAAEELLGIDVVLTTGRPSDLVAAAIDYPSLAAIRDDLVVVNISPFGLSGPRTEWRGGNLIAAASGGMVFVNGWPDEPPLQPLGLQAYHVAGVLGAIGALLALRVRDNNGRGQLVDISLQESAVAALEHVTGVYRERGTIAQRSGTLHWTRTFRTVPARDGEVLASHLGDWDALSEWIAAETGNDALRDDRWRSPAYRRQHCEALFQIIADWSGRRPARMLVEQAQARRLPFAPINTLREAARHPQLEARNFFRSQKYPPFLFAEKPIHPSPRAARHSPLSSPLTGITVIDLTWVVAGPVATRVLADHGAEVIKVEHPRTATDVPRRGGLFGNLNRGKQSVVLDLQTPTGRETLRRLLEVGDVLVENFSPRVLANWGFDDEALRVINPRLTVVHMSGFGRSGPLRDWVSYGPTLQAQLGFTSNIRHPRGRPAGWGYSYSDMISGYTAALAVIAALRQGGGQHIDLSQLEVLASVIAADLASARAGADHGAVGNGSQEGEFAPHGVYRCADTEAPSRERWCAITVFDDRQWRALAEQIDARWLRDRRFASARDRHHHAAALDRAVEGWTRHRAAEDVVQRLQASGIPAGLVADAQDLLRGDPHLRARGMWCEVVTAEGEGVELDAPAIRLNATPAVIRATGPLLGEHTVEALRRVLASGETD